MSSVVEETLDNVQVMLDDIKEKHLQIRARIESSNRNSKLSEGTQKIQDLGKCLANIEEGKCRNTTTLNSVLSMMKSLTEKVDKLDIKILSRKLQSETQTETNSIDESLNEMPVCDKSADSKVKEAIPKDNKKYENVELQSAVASNENMDTKENAQNQSKVVTKKLQSKSQVSKALPKTPSSLTKSVNISQRRVLTLQLDTKQLSPIRKSIDGLKSRTTNQTDDNRSRFYKKIECFQGDLVEPVEQTADSQTSVDDPPNIVVVAHSDRSVKDDKRWATGKSSKLMTMAEMAARDFEGKKEVRNLKEWHQVFLMNELQVALGGLGNLLNRSEGRGHDYMLLLDTSESMRGEKFSNMLRAAHGYLDGVQQVTSRTGIQDNIGLACFGEDTKMVLTPTTDYNQIRNEIDKLKPGGPSPLAAGLLMALSGVSHRGTRICNHDFKARIIVLSDGLPTRVEAPNEEDRDVSKELAMSFLFENRDRDREINKVAEDIANRGIRVFCIPLGSVTTDVLKRVAENTCGKIIPSEQIHRLCRHTEVLYNSSEIADALLSSAEVDRNLVKSSILAAGSEVQTLNTYDDITDNVMLLLDPKSQYPGRFKNPKHPAVRLGTRVRRGPNWNWNDQDSNMAGTVIGEDNDGGMIWVEWDSGNKNCYNYNVGRNVYDIKPVNEPRRLVDEMIAVGCKVKRGRHWTFGDQDGGRGSRGTVLRVESNGKVVVYWDHGRLGVYKFASDDLFEVEVCEHGRTLSSPDLIQDDDGEIEEKDTSELPLILPTHTRKKKPVTFTWKFQDKDGEWVAYDNETNAKIEHAYSRNHEGKCIIEIDKTIYIIHFSKMMKENQADKTPTSVRRMALMG